jgi:hypothetical protein
VSTHATYLRRGALTLGAVTIGGYLADYGFNLALTRFLTPHEYGDFRVAFAFAFFFGLAVLLGGDRAAPMVLAPCLERGETRKVWEYLRFYLVNACALSLALAAVVWTASYLHVGSSDPQDHHPFAWVRVQGADHPVAVESWSGPSPTRSPRRFPGDGSSASEARNGRSGWRRARERTRRSTRLGSSRGR